MAEFGGKGGCGVNIANSKEEVASRSRQKAVYSRLKAESI
jgi:hypothetical protein